jgi:triacylglycerol esterase/lipase EstA (alpha/beta hydrolase family)
MVDLWSSPNHHSMLGITAVYVNESKKLEKCILAMKTVEGSHSGVNLSKYVIEVIEKWQITSKLGFMVMDNASSNDTMIKEIATILATKYSSRYDAQLHRMRCQGHIINLVAHSFIFATKDEELEGDEEAEDIRIKSTPVQMKEWRKKGMQNCLQYCLPSCYS